MLVHAHTPMVSLGTDIQVVNYFCACSNTSRPEAAKQARGPKSSSAKLQEPIFLTLGANFLKSDHKRRINQIGVVIGSTRILLSAQDNNNIRDSNS